MADLDSYFTYGINWISRGTPKPTMQSTKQSIDGSIVSVTIGSSVKQAPRHKFGCEWVTSDQLEAFRLAAAIRIPFTYNGMNLIFPDQITIDAKPVVGDSQFVDSDYNSQSCLDIYNIEFEMIQI